MKASQGIARIDVAIAHGRRAIDAAASMFQGTLPPPPWPSPELYKAIDEAKDVRDRLDVFVRHGDPEFNAKTPQVAHVVATVEKQVNTIERLAAQLEGRAELVATRTPSQLVAQVKQAATSPKLIGLAIVGYLLWRAEKK